jgi:hypothetical protein
MLTYVDVFKGPAQESDEKPSEEVLDRLYSIKTTLFCRSFASRLSGFSSPKSTVWMRDWETRTIWMELLKDIHDHYYFRT